MDTAAPQALPKTRNYSAEDRNNALANLRDWLKPGDTLYTVLRHRAASGMYRRIGLVVIDLDRNGKPAPTFPDYAAAAVLDIKLSDKGEGVPQSGAGMDMGFHLVHNLSRALFDGDGYALNHRWL